MKIYGDISLLGVTEDEHDWLVELSLPDGRKCKIAIPQADPARDYVAVRDGQTYWLNFVTDYHYT